MRRELETVALERTRARENAAVFRHVVRTHTHTHTRATAVLP